jgi:protein-tyrosine-phosphatase
MPRTAPRSVLFACNLNTIRSPIAAGLLMRRGGGRIHAESCGVWPGGRADPFMIEVMREKDVDLAHHEPRTFEQLGAANFDLIVAFTEDSFNAAKVFARTLSSDVEHWPVGDPSEGGEGRAAKLQAYREARDAIDALIREGIEGRSTAGP